MKTPSRRTLRGARGFAMLAAMMVMALMAIVSIAVLTSAGASRRRAIRYTRAEVREGCAFAGLNYARNYFANRFGSWNTYLNTPGKYDPLSTTWAKPLSGALEIDRARVLTNLASNPELLVDLDSDDDPDVFIFIRDNFDEFPPATPSPTSDNDQNVIVGAVCISNTMQPRREDRDRTIDPDSLMAEALLGYNQQANSYSGQANGGNGAGNLNN